MKASATLISQASGSHPHHALPPTTTAPFPVNPLLCAATCIYCWGSWRLSCRVCGQPFDCDFQGAMYHIKDCTAYKRATATTYCTVHGDPAAPCPQHLHSTIEGWAKLMPGGPARRTSPSALLPTASGQSPLLLPWPQLRLPS